MLDDMLRMLSFIRNVEKRNMKKTIIPLLILSVSLMGCPEHTCVNNSINTAFIGFSAADIDTIVLRAYQVNTNFQRLERTVVVINRNPTIYTTLHDTTIVYVNSNDRGDSINPGFDWQIYIPAKQKTVSISNIMTDATQGRRGCSNPIMSFVQDGKTIIPHRVDNRLFYTSGYRAYVTN